MAINKKTKNLNQIVSMNSSGKKKIRKNFKMIENMQKFFLTKNHFT